MNNTVQKILIAAEDAQMSPEQKQDPNVIKQMLLKNLSQSVSEEVILNQIYPDVNQRGLEQTVAGKNGVIIFKFKNNTQKIWNPQNKEYGEMPTQAKLDYTKRIIKKAVVDRGDESWLRELSKNKNQEDPSGESEKARLDPNVIYRQLSSTLGSIIPAEVIYTQILPSVTDKGLGSTKNLGGGKIVFDFNDGTQGIWSGKNKKYTEAISKKDYKRTILKRAMKLKKPPK